MTQHYVGTRVVSIGQKSVGVKIIRVRGKSLPKEILYLVVSAIEKMLQIRAKHSVNGQQAVQIKYRDQVAMVGTRFHRNKKGSGLLFHVFLLLRNAVKLTGKYPVKTEFERTRTSFIVQPFDNVLSF